MRTSSKIAWLMCLTASSTGAAAHHSYTEFNQRETVEIEGTLTVVAWQNPHTRLEVRVPGSNDPVLWDIETGSVNSMRRQGVPLDALQVGDTVKIAGWPSKRSAARLYATNLLGRGHELLFQGGAPRWPGSATHRESFTAATSEPAAAVEMPTLFRVWAIDANDPDTRPGFLSRFQYSLTDSAKQAVADFDPVTQSVSTGCTPKGMPLLMGQPFPIEFVDRGDTILLRLEEYDAVRTIYLTEAAQRAPQAASPLGRSLGRWDNGTLVVETDRIDTPYFSSTGIPLSKAARTLERFSLSSDGRRLVYNLTVTDPATFAAPAQAMRAWVARDGEQVLPFDCKSPRY
jgi:hypothetical protein